MGEQQEFDGMPACWGLRVITAGGRTLVFHGPLLMFDFAEDDVAMRNLAMVSLTGSGLVSGKDAGPLFGVRPEHISRLRSDYARGGPAALAPKRMGRPPDLSPAQVRQARIWAGQRVSHAEIGRRLGVPRSVVTETLGRSGGPIEETAGLFEPAGTATGPGDAGGAEAAGRPGDEGSGAGEPGAGEPGAGVVPAAGARISEGVLATRYAGAMLVHAYAHRLGMAALPGQAVAGVPGGAGGPRYDDIGVLCAVQAAFSLGFVSVEQFKYLPPGEAGPLAGWDKVPSLRALRPRLAAIADSCDPVELLGGYFAAMMRTDPGRSRVFYVDDHFISYTGEQPAGKGWNNRRGRAGKGRFDTLVTSRGGAVAGWSTTEPSGLSRTLPPALGRLRDATGPGRRLLLGFDRGGAYPGVFTQIRAQGAHWITYRRAPLASTRLLPALTAITRSGASVPVAAADEIVTLDGYDNGSNGSSSSSSSSSSSACRQLTVFEHGKVVLQVLTSDLGSCAEWLLQELIGRWGIENAVKYGTEHYGTDLICGYAFTTVPGERTIKNPARKAANTALRAARAALDTARAGYPEMLSDPAIPAADKNKTLIREHEQRIAAAERAVRHAETARDAIPAEIAANQAGPEAVRAIHATSRRALQMLLRLTAANAEHWLAGQLNATLNDDDEYRSITRNLIRQTPGTITYTPRAITVRLDRPHHAPTAAAVEALLGQLNATAPRMPGDPRPISYSLAP
ncbi:MAG TPA: hypothetical protein VMV92_08145 [Streptosporangiaceae bacterium]|nr:hypothetical protein [Streptosporangiaceae bacterium]